MSRLTATVTIVRREQTPAERLRRHSIILMRELAKQYPREYAEIGRELVPSLRKPLDIAGDTDLDSF